MRAQAQFRLLVVRLGAMGDILHALPAVTALRRMHPAWKIDWAIKPKWLPLLSAEAKNAELDGVRTAARPVVDQIYAIPVQEWSQRPLAGDTWDGVRALRTALRAAEYDAVLDFQGAVRSALVARLSGCRRILGEADPREFAAKWLFTERVATAGKHVIDQDMELAAAVAGDPLKTTTPALPVDLDAEEWCDRLREVNSALGMGRPIVLIHPGGGWGAKRWPAERYGEVAAELVYRGGTVLINSAPGEGALAEAVVAGSDGKAMALECSLGELIALTRRVSLVIGGDTGPLHLACALDKPVVGIYGPTDPRRNGPYGSRFRVLRNPESRQDHTRREATEAGLLTITPRMVMEACAELMLEVRQEQGAELALRRGVAWTEEASDGPVWEADLSDS